MPTKTSTIELPETTLPDNVETLKQMVKHLLSDMQSKDREILNLKCQMEALKRRIFGRSSEKIDPHQLALIGKLYEVEREAKENKVDADTRQVMRQERSVPILDDIEEKLQTWSVEVLPKNPVAQAIGYARNQWTALNRYLDDGRLPIDNNIAERALRMAAVGRKNWLYFGSDAGGHRAAAIYSLVGSCKLCGIDPFAYLRDVISRTCDPKFNQFDELTPLAWKAVPQTNLYS